VEKIATYNFIFNRTMAALEEEQNTCCLKTCVKKISYDTDSRVDVRAFNVSSSDRKGNKIHVPAVRLL